MMETHQIIQDGVEEMLKSLNIERRTLVDTKDKKATKLWRNIK